MAASFLFAVIGTGVLFKYRVETNTLVAKATLPSIEPASAIQPAVMISNPEHTAAIVAQLELMRHGNCQLIEAIQLPDSQKAIYINMVVNGHVSTDPKEQLIALDLIKRTRCNYTPMLMANSRG